MADSLIVKVNGIPSYETARRLAPVVPTLPGKDDDDIVEYAWKQKVRKVGDGEDDYIIEEVVEEVSRCNRQAFIAKDADNVGVLNILEKVRRSGDLTLLNQTHSQISGELQDYTNVPTSIGEALSAVQTGADSFAALRAIFGDISFDQLANMSSDEIASALNNYVASQQTHTEGENK